MGPPTCLTDPTAPVVLDTSVTINLIATGYADRILRSLPHRRLVVDMAAVELEEGRRRGRCDADLLQELVSAGLIEIVTLSDDVEAIFETLVVGGTAQTLDDGEAATIAYAAAHGAIAIIDERKAIRICGQRFPALALGNTVDLLSHPAAVRALGGQDLSQAIANALQNARMRVLPQHVEWVLSLIEREQAARFASLPRSARQPHGNLLQQKA